jgi:hypothetical protein
MPAHRTVPVGGGGAGPVRAGTTCIARLRRKEAFLTACASNRDLRRARTREYVATEPAVYAYRSTSTTTRVVHRPRTPPGIFLDVRCCKSCVLVLPPSKMPSDFAALSRAIHVVPARTGPATPPPPAGTARWVGIMIGSEPRGWWSGVQSTPSDARKGRGTREISGRGNRQHERRLTSPRTCSRPPLGRRGVHEAGT